MKRPLVFTSFVNFPKIKVVTDVSQEYIRLFGIQKNTQSISKVKHLKYRFKLNFASDFICGAIHTRCS